MIKEADFVVSVNDPELYTNQQASARHRHAVAAIELHRYFRYSSRCKCWIGAITTTLNDLVRCIKS